MIFLIDSWKAVLLTAPDRARERSTRLLVDEAFRIHMAFLLGNGFGWCKISFSANIMPASLILITFFLERAVEDAIRVLVTVFLRNGFGWCSISVSANIISDSLIFINFLLQRAVKDVFHVLVALVVLVVAAE